MQVKNTKLCFELKSRTSSTLTSYPNFVFDPHLTSPRPHRSKSPIPINCNHKLIESTLLDSNFHEEQSHKVCQMIVISRQKEKAKKQNTYKYFLDVCSCTFLKYKNKIFGGTVLHAFRTQGNVRMCILNLSNKDIRPEVKNLREKFKGNWSSFQTQLTKLVSRQKQLFKTMDLLEDGLTNTYLKFRKVFLERVVNPKQLLVPDIGLHAVPSLDFIPFELPAALTEFISENEYFFCLDKQYQDMISSDQKLYLLSYQSNNQSVNFESHDYNQLKTKVSFLKKSQLKNQQMQASVFVHSGKSLSVSEYVDSTSCIIVYRGNALEGSSGGAIYDENGRILGIGFGYIADDTQQQQIEKRPQLQWFDIDLTELEKKKNYRRLKNFNLGTRINTKHIRSFLDEHLERQLD